MRVLIIDDTVLIRQYLRNIIETTFDDVEVMVAPSGLIGIEKIKLYNPDVITLDFEMPIMNGIECLKEIKKITDAPVIMVSSYTSEGAQITMDALNLGAFDFICKPNRKELNAEDDFEVNLMQKIQAAFNFRQKGKSIHPVQFVDHSKTEPEKKSSSDKKQSNIEIIGIGISTGGPPVVTEILKSLPKDYKIPILVVQHMPGAFTGEFAKRLDTLSKLNVKEAQDNDIIKPGTAYIAQGGKHMEIKRDSNKSYIKIYKGDKISGHVPSANLLFSSIAQTYGDKSVGIIATGMGADGSEGLLKMKDEGANIWAQNEESCVVFGMPKSAIDVGAVTEVLSVEQIIKNLKEIGA